MKNIISSIYYNPKDGFVGLDKLYKKVKAKEAELRLGGGKEPTVTRNQVAAWLKKQETSQLHKQNPKKRSEMKQIVGPIGSYQADLMFFPKWKKQNRGYTIILTMIEVNSRKGYALPLKQKDGKSVPTAFEEILEDIKEDTGQSEIFRLETDEGTEFTGKEFQKVLKKHNIIWYPFNREDHSSLARIERLNGTIRRKLNLYMTANNNVIWIDALADMMEGYNETTHTGLENRAPNDITVSDEMDIIQSAVKLNKALTKEQAFQVGDKVRKRLLNKTFKKGGDLEWSRKVYTIKEKVGNQFDIGLTKPVAPNNLQEVKEIDNKVQPIVAVKQGKKVREAPAREKHNRRDKVRRNLRKEGVDVKQIQPEKRVTRQTTRFTLKPVEDFEEEKEEAKRLNKLHKNKSFTDEGEKFKISKIYFDTRRKKILVDYTDKNREGHFSLFSEISEHL